MRDSDFKSNLISLAALAAHLALPGLGHGQSAEALPSARLDLCAVFQDLESYRDKLLEVTGTLTTGKELAGGLTDAKCDHKLVTDGFVWPVALDVVTTEDQAVKGIVPFETDLDSVRNAYRKAKELAGEQNRSVKMTLVGYLRLPKKYQRVRVRNGLGPDDFTYMGNGFGHMGFFPGELIVRRVIKVELDSQENPPVKPSKGKTGGNGISARCSIFLRDSCRLGKRGQRGLLRFMQIDLPSRFSRRISPNFPLAILMIA